MKTEERKKTICRYILGAIGGLFMAAGDWLLGCIPIEGSDTGMFDRAYYLSGAYGLWRPGLIVGLGAIGSFLYYFMVKALNADIDAKYRKTKAVHLLCGIFTVSVALAIHLWSATLAWFTAYLGPRLPRSRPIRTVCSPRSCRCMRRWWRPSGSTFCCCLPARPVIPAGCSLSTRSHGTSCSS